MEEIWGIKKKTTIFGTFLDRHKHILPHSMLCSPYLTSAQVSIISWDMENVLSSSADHHWHIPTLSVTHLTNWHLQLPTKYRTKTPVSYNNTAQHFTNRINTSLNGAQDTTTISLSTATHILTIGLKHESFHYCLFMASLILVNKSSSTG